MHQEFSRRLHVKSPPAQVWQRLLDVHRVASWVSIVRSVEEVQPLSRYQAVLEDRLGPFTLRADLDIIVDELVEGRLARAHAVGEDRQVSSGIRAAITLNLDTDGPGTVIEVAGNYEVTGRVATLGAASIRKKADRIMEEFFTHAAAEL